MDVQSGYDAVASAYADRFRDELGDKPFDMRMLDWLAERAAGIGPICDVGCGPGQVAAYLRTRGCDVCGVDLSAEMVRHASRLNPDVPFEQGDMRDLVEIADAAYGGVAAFCSIVNHPRADHPQAFTELRRVLRAGGWLLLTFHVGDEVRHVDEFLGATVFLDFHFFAPRDARDDLNATGFDITEVIERDPYSESLEAQTERAYIFARSS